MSVFAVASQAAQPSPLSETVDALAAARRASGVRKDEGRDIESFPSRGIVAGILDLLFAAIYPRRMGQFRGTAAAENVFVAAKLLSALTELERQVAAEFLYWQHEASRPFEDDQAATLVRLFGATLADIRCLVDSDVEVAFLADPAARSVDEVLVCYPGVIASLHHRVAHQLDSLGAPIVARIISELANERTGIDIHPGAKIGSHFFIDHGTGVVIGQTAVIGQGVRLYQHVTLGAGSAFESTAVSAGRHARHPIIGDGVVIYAGATILGPVRIGDRATIGGNVWLLSDVAPDTVVVQPEAIRLSADDGLALRDALERRGER